MKITDRIEITNCPKCGNKQTVGVVLTTYKKHQKAKSTAKVGLFCSNCLTEFKSNGEIIEKLYA